jgi:hypothetical protein
MRLLRVLGCVSRAFLGQLPKTGDDEGISIKAAVAEIPAAVTREKKP